MTISAILMLVLQLFSNYETYHSNERIFKSGVDNALKQSVTKLMNIRRDEFADQYKKWLLDTNLTIISTKFDGKENIFSIEDKNPTDKDFRPPFDLAWPTYNEKIDKITPKIKVDFVNSFVKDFLYSDFVTGRVLFFTTGLGERQAKAFENDSVDLPRLRRIYLQELAKEDIKAPFKFKVNAYNFKRFNYKDSDSLAQDYVTHANLYGFGKQVAIVAVFPNIAAANFAKMKWMIFSSLVLIGITIACFTYTLNTMLSQKKLTKLKDDFVNNMTHELKTPIATIGIAAEAIQDFEANKTMATEYLGIIRSQASDMNNLIEQLLSSLLAEQTAIPLTVEKISFRNVIVHTLQQYQPQIQVANAKVSTTITDMDLFINGDEKHLRNVVANLIDNAIKYSVDVPNIKIILEKHHNQAIFKISNVAEEIPPMYLDRLFEKFFRVPTGNLHLVKGYGLGLSYVFYIVSQHKGYIDVISEGDLITFTLTLPIDDFA